MQSRPSQVPEVEPTLAELREPQELQIPEVEAELASQLRHSLPLVDAAEPTGVAAVAMLVMQSSDSEFNPMYIG